ncbi:MAG: plastocyanin/azurin family copper-binding protein [Planctomycetota bacterium]
MTRFCSMGLALLLATGMAQLSAAQETRPGGSGSGTSISGTLKVTGTKVKTKGSKSQKHVVIYLEKVGDKSYPPPPKEPVEMDQKNLVFIPHVMAVQKGTKVDFLNSDSVDHNVFCVDDCCKILEPGKKKFLDLGNWGKGDVRSHTFNTPGEAVLLCRLHPEMAAYLIVLETPYFTVAEVDGKTLSASYAIENVPPGKYLLRAWNKKCGSPDKEVTIEAGKSSQVDFEISRKKRKRRKKG